MLKFMAKEPLRPLWKLIEEEKRKGLLPEGDALLSSLANMKIEGRIGLGHLDFKT